MGEPMTTIQRLLVIDDDQEVCEFIEAVSNAMNLNCIVTSESDAFLKALTPDTTLVMLDLLMPDMDGIELLRLLGKQHCNTPIVLMSGVGKRIIETAEALARSLGLTIAGHLEKPFRLAALEALLQKQVEARVAPPSHGKLKIVIPDSELLNAIVQNQFVLHYQPQLNLLTNHVVGVEALVRWQHPERGLIFPDDFISRLESMGLIGRLGWIVTNRGLEEIKQAADSRGCLPVLSLNVSVCSLYDLDFPDLFVSRLKKHGVSARSVILEITESGLIKQLSNTLDVLTRLRMKQIHLSIDDFGTGYAMMQQLRLVPATELKIDKSFVQNMHLNDSDRVMVRKTIEIGHDLGMKVVAEGVETQEQYEFLRANGCDLAQGYFFSRALPMPELVHWLEDHRTLKRA
jgi:EAL domain-containing protein (putative c-di-GMP-specific phosphodiesterase class I)/CheY-like chemotaxis protein